MYWDPVWLQSCTVNKLALPLRSIELIQKKQSSMEGKVSSSRYADITELHACAARKFQHALLRRFSNKFATSMA